MNRTRLVFRHEFVQTIRKKGFVILILSLPVLAILGIGIFRIASGVTVPAAAVMRIGYVDNVGGFDQFTSQKGADLVPFDSPGDATEALVQRSIDEYFIIPSDYVATGVIARYTLQKELAPPPVAAAAIKEFLSANLLAGRIPPDVISRIEAPLIAITTTLTSAGAVAADQGGFGSFIIPALFSVLLSFALMFTSNYVLQGLSEEKENRLMEILLSSVSTRQLVTGKLLGRGAAGLLQVLIWVISLPLLLRLASSTLGGLLSTIQLPPAVLLIGVAYFILGYSMFAVLLLGIAAVTSSTREAQALAPIFTMFAVAPFWFSSLLVLFPNSPVWVVFSIVPFSAPVLVMLRLGLTGVPAWQLALSMAVLAFSTVGGLMLVARLLRTYLLMYGKRPHLREILRSIRTG